MLSKSCDQELIVLHVAPILNKISGLNHAVFNLLRAERGIGIHVGLLNTVTEGEVNDKYSELFPMMGERTVFRSDTLEHLVKPFNKPGIMHFHWLSNYGYFRLAGEAHRKNIPFIITPHGGLTWGAQSERKNLKIFTGNRFFQAGLLKSASAIHFVSQEEAESSVKNGRPYFVLPYGVQKEKARVDLDKDIEDPRKKIRLLFVGRYDVHQKGIDLLLKGFHLWWKINRENLFRLRIVGPDYGGQKPEIQRLIQKFRFSNMVELFGPATGEALIEHYRWAHVFIHPSRFEGMPLSVLDALTRGLPCIVTPATGLAGQIETMGAGWSVEPKEEKIAAMLATVLQNRNQLRRMGQNARLFIESQNDWEAVAAIMGQYYHKILAGERWGGVPITGDGIDRHKDV